MTSRTEFPRIESEQILGALRLPGVQSMRLGDQQRARMSIVPREGEDYWLSSPMTDAEFRLTCVLRRVVNAPDNTLLGILSMSDSWGIRKNSTILTRFPVVNDPHVRVLATLRMGETWVHTDAGAQWIAGIALNALNGVVDVMHSGTSETEVIKATTAHCEIAEALRPEFWAPTSFDLIRAWAQEKV